MPKFARWIANDMRLVLRIFLLRRKGFSRIPCEEHSPFSSWKLSFFTSQGQPDSGREVTASMFHSISSRAHCSVQKPGHVLISPVPLWSSHSSLLLFQPLGLYLVKGWTILTASEFTQQLLGRYLWLAISFLSSSALFPWTVKITGDTNFTHWIQSPHIQSI